MGHRIRPRRFNGRFKRGTLADIGMTVCPECGRIVPIKFDETNGIIDPRSRRADCDHTDTSGNLMVQEEPNE